jgi:phospholipid transport system transporter-binding protein
MPPTSQASFALEPVHAYADGQYRFTGVFGFATAAAALARGTHEFGHHRRVDVDLSGVTSADSAGLAVMLAWVEFARRRGIALRFHGLPAQVAAIAAISDVAALLRGAEHAGTEHAGSTSA